MIKKLWPHGINLVVRSLAGDWGAFVLQASRQRVLKRGGLFCEQVGLHPRVPSGFKSALVKAWNPCETS